MARLWPSTPDTNHFLRSAATGAFAAATPNLCLMAIVRLSTAPSAETTAIIIGGAGGAALRVVDLGSGIVLRYTKVNVAHVTGTATTTMPLNAWRAIMGVMLAGGNVVFKVYNYDTSSLATETITDANALGTPTSEPITLGQWATSLASTPWMGDMDRAVGGNGVPSDAEFIAWARAGTMPTTGFTMLGHWILSPAGTSVSPEEDLHPTNNNDLTVTGTSASAAFVLPDAAAVYTQSAYRWRAKDGSLFAPP